MYLHILFQPFSSNLPVIDLAMSDRTPMSRTSKKWSCETLEAGIEAAAKMAGLNLKTPENQKFFEDRELRSRMCSVILHALLKENSCVLFVLCLSVQETRKMMLNMHTSAA